MTPAARVAAAMTVLDVMAGDVPAEQALTRWGRQNRYAGSKDRAAVRDHVFDVLRRRQEVETLGGSATGRGLMMGLLLQQELDLEAFFTGEGYAPPPLTEEERNHVSSFIPPTEPAWNIPDWLRPEFERSLGEDALRTAHLLQHRAPVCLRVNTAKATRSEAVKALNSEGIEATENPVAENAVTLGNGARKLRQTDLYTEGAVELQDAASQAVVDALPDAARCLDYCAGGGGKALAIAAQPGREVFAHDADPARMSDLANRATRAGAEITTVATADLAGLAPFDLVLCDAPCSGSGAWRRAPEGKWSLTPERLTALTKTQLDILTQAAQLVQSGGWLAYATCSVLSVENEDLVAEFLRQNPQWTRVFEKRFAVGAQNDGFYTAHLTQVQA